MCWFIAYKDIQVSSLLTLVFECVSVACILALAAVSSCSSTASPIDTDQRQGEGHDASTASAWPS